MKPFRSFARTRMDRSNKKTASYSFYSKLALRLASKLFSRQNLLLFGGVYVIFLLRKISTKYEDSDDENTSWIQEYINPKKEKPGLKVVSLNDKYDNYDESMCSALEGKAAAFLFKQKLSGMKELSRKFAVVLRGIDREKLQSAEKLCNQFLQEHAEKENKDLKSVKETENKTGLISPSNITEVLKDSLPSDKLKVWETAMKSASLPGGDLVIEALRRALYHEQVGRVFVLTFPGDITASGVSHLREEITAILSTARPGDDVVLKLSSGGGTVVGYGLAASQLTRLKLAGVQLLVCVDDVAASGGYLMAAVADRIYAAPFAVLGSIGVVATIPNISARLEREGIDVLDVTAGKFKRTLVPYRRVTKADKDKVQEQVDIALDHFKDYLKRHRPSLDVEQVATGETWSGRDALDKGLCDVLMTSDELLYHLRKEGREIYSVNHRSTPTKVSPGIFSSLTSEGISSVLGNILWHMMSQQIYKSFQDKINGSDNDVTQIGEENQMPAMAQFMAGAPHSVNQRQF